MKQSIDFLIANINLKENAQFFKKDRNRFYTANRINEIFSETAINKIGQYLLNVNRYWYEPIQAEVSMCVFKMIQTPAFISQFVAGWEEHKIGYLLLIDFGDYVIVFKKNAENSDKLYQGLTEISYKVLSTIFVADDTVFEKVSLNNTSVLSDAITRRVLEANNLNRSMSTYGLGKYIANSVRINNASEKTSVVFNTSRITNFGDKKDIYNLVLWSQTVVEKIRGFIERDTFVNVFAEPIEYTDVRGTLTPISILIQSSNLQDDFEEGKIVRVEYRYNGRTIPITINRIVKTINQVFTVSQVDEDGDISYILDNAEIKEIKDVELVLNSKSITLRSTRASRIYLWFNDNTTKSLLQYLNLDNEYIINFEELDLVYYQRRLFKDRGLLNNMEGFLNVFAGIRHLNAVISEKGEGYFTPGCIVFPSNSIFEYVDTQMLPGSDYSFLDDLGDEWADFIMLRDSKITFIHAKHKNARMSATAFQDVVAQALKNIGNFKPTTDRLDNKERSLGAPYQIDGVATGINKLRTGGILSDGIAAYKNLLMHPNLQREIILVVDFISKVELQANLERLKNGEAFAQRNQVIQILWIISGLINCCMENGITIYIHCKP